MKKTEIIGLILIMLILLLMPLYQRLIMGQKSADRTERDSLSVAIADTAKSPESAHSSTSITEAETTTTARDTSAVKPLVNIPEKEIFVKTDKFTIVISTLGGDVKSIKLRNIYDHHGEEIELAPNPLGGRNFAFSGMAKGQFITTEDIRFIADKDSLVLSENNPTDAVTMVGMIGEMMVQRRYEFTNGAYHFRNKIFLAMQDTSIIIEDGTLWWKSGLLPTEENRRGDVNEFSAVYRYGDVVDRTKPKKKEFSISSDGATDWIGISSKYFCVTLLPDDEKSAEGFRINTQWQSIPAEKLEVPLMQI